MTSAVLAVLKSCEPQDESLAWCWVVQCRDARHVCFCITADMQQDADDAPSFSVHTVKISGVCVCVCVSECMCDCVNVRVCEVR